MAKRRASLMAEVAEDRATKAVDVADRVMRDRGRKVPEGRRMDRTVTTSINIDSDLVELLRVVAAKRANREGGRASVSRVIEAVLEDNRADLQREAEA